ncbi:MAG: rRNA maturation RNase YbeY [Akkermansia sp.]|nr:rRNA maturation RNase YbeY [Akkermansia sp.]
MIPQIEIYLNTERDWVTEKLLQDFAAALQILLPELLATPKGPDHVLSTLPVVEIAVVDDDAIAQVHAEFLDDPTATDAITFPYGEILVSCDTAARYAEAHGISPQEELFRYMVHGLTHLHGYLDYTPEDRAALFAIQEPLVEHFFPRG